MRIVVDISDISPRRGKSRGIYSYARHLVAAMAPALPAGASLSVLCNGDSLDDFAPMRNAAVRVVPVYPGFPGVLQRVLWCLLTGALAVRRERADIYFSPKGFAPLGLRALGRVGRVVVTVHDLIPLWYARHHPAAVGFLERSFINNWLAHSARSADGVVAISQATADALKAELGRDRGVSVVHNGLPPLPAASQNGSRDVIFAMTSPLAHKNLPGVLAAYASYRALTPAPLPLVVCGVPGSLADGVTGIVDVAPDELARLYAHARVFLFLPLIEGFGFPVVEALHHGAPVVCSDIPSLRESSGGAATFVDPLNATACAIALRDVVAGRVGAVRASARALSAHDSWARCARATLSAVIGEPTQRRDGGVSAAASAENAAQQPSPTR